jgi:chitin disaccharide deacetylase
VRQLIVNADDFGLTKRVSAAIVDAHRHGIVSSTTLMANGGAFQEAAALSLQVPHLGIGAHLNLSEGEPVSPALRIPSLVDARGRLYLTPGRLWKGIASRRVSLADVERELQAQIVKIQRAGILPTHLDGHKHVHVLPGVSDTVIRLAREFSIPSVRCPVEEPPALSDLIEGRRSGHAAIFKQYLVGRGVSAFARRFRQRLAEAGLHCPTYFYGLSCTGFLNTRRIQEVLSRLQEGTSELMCHPGYADAALAKTGTRLLAEREVETFALCSPLIKRLLADSRIRLVNYQALAGRPQSGAVAA